LSPLAAATAAVVVVAASKDAAALQSCKQNSDCKTGYCVVSSHGKVCTTTCIDGCQNGWICAPIPGKNAISLCLDPYGMRCNPCTVDNDCQVIAGEKSGDRCIALGASGRFCARACKGEADCPAGATQHQTPFESGFSSGCACCLRAITLDAKGKLHIFDSMLSR